MEGYFPGRSLGNIEVHDDWILAAANYYGFDWLVRTCVHLLMRNPWRNVNEIAWSGLFREFQMVAPAETGASTNDVENSLEVAMVMGCSSRVWIHYDSPSP